MSAWLIALVGVIYFYIAVEQTMKGSPWMGVVYIGYALANVGFYHLAVK